MHTINIALIGAGKIARDQHVPALASNSAFKLVATASPHDQLDGVKSYPSLEALLAGSPNVDAVALCTPPQVRCELARRAIEHGCHVLLEKPPGVSLDEVQTLVELARERRVALFSAWHSREAAGVEPAREWLAECEIRSVTVTWKEDVRVWHPGQHWIWQAGGLGVFDPGINALSILTHVLPGTMTLQAAELAVPLNCATPIAAKLQLIHQRGTHVSMELDFLYDGPPAWDIDVETDAGPLRLSRGGAVMHRRGETAVSAGDMEYARLYARFARLIAERAIDVDVAPLALVVDALRLGKRTIAPPFHDESPD